MNEPTPSEQPRRRRRGRGRGEELMVPEATFTSYYGRPIVKPAPWDWKIPAYLYAGGAAAGAALVSAGAELTGRVALQRSSRLVSLTALGVGSAALVGDLGRPERFLNMMRTVKPTSPMSIGSWILTAFAGFSTVAAAAEATQAALDVRRAVAHRGRVGAVLRGSESSSGVAGLTALARVALGTQGPMTVRLASRVGTVDRRLAAIDRGASLGAGFFAPPLAAYTAVLLADTATPTWHGIYQELPFVFVGSALAAGAGAAAAAAPSAQSGPARRLAVGGAAAEFAAYTLLSRRAGLIGEPLHQGHAGRLLTASKALTIGGAVTMAALGRWRPAAVVGGLALNLGSALTRFGIVEAGIASTQDPKYIVVPQRERLAARGLASHAGAGPGR